MIDTNELRNDANTAHYGHLPLEVSGSEMLELLDRLEAAEKECNVLRDDRATLQQMVYSLKDRVEVVEKECESWKGLAQQFGNEADALRVEVGKLKDLEVARCVKINGYIVDNARLAEEVERLQAKIAELEKQVEKQEPK